MKPEGTRVVITGAGSGIGRSAALLYAKKGAEVVCVDIDGEAAGLTAQDINDAGAELRASARVCDVSSAEAVHDLADAIEAEDGPVGIVVNNAGVGTAGRFLDQSVEDWDWLMGINLDGVAYGSRAFGAAMVDRGEGHVVNIASGAAYMMSRDMAAYCASKAAVVAFSRCLRADWAATGVGVSVICPGVINTPIASNTRMSGAMAAQQEKIQSRFRFGHSPEIVAKAIVKAAEKNQTVVPVGIESEIAFRVTPLIPRPIHELITRTPLSKLV